MAVELVTPGVWRAGTRFVNWYAVDGGAGGLTVVDAGLPDYRRRLAATLRAIGRTDSDAAMASLERLGAVTARLVLPEPRRTLARRRRRGRGQRPPHGCR